MTEQQFKPGDLVQLKSGGPIMTVAKIGSDGRPVCEWFDGKKPDSRYFEATSLQKADGLSFA